MTVIGTVIFTLLTIIVCLVVLSLILPIKHPLNMAGRVIMDSSSTNFTVEGDVVTMERDNNVPLFVYTGTPVSSRKWTTFYDRKHDEPRSPLLSLIAKSYPAHHIIGGITEISDEYLLKVLHSSFSNDIIKEIAGKRGKVSLQHDRILRDALLMKVVCENGGILIPHNALLMNNTGILWDHLSKTPDNTILISNTEGNSDLGCPIIVTRGGTSLSDVVTKSLFTAGSMREFYGGISFGGGSLKIMDRLRNLGLDIHTLHGVTSVRVDELTENTHITNEIKHSVIVVIPFPQGSGTTSITRRDEWIYSEEPDRILENPILLQKIIVESHRNRINTK